MKVWSVLSSLHSSTPEKWCSSFAVSALICGHRTFRACCLCYWGKSQGLFWTLWLMDAGYRPKRKILSSHVWVKLVMGRVLSEIIYMIDSQDSTYCSALLLETPFQTLTLHRTCRKRVIFHAKQVAVERSLVCCHWVTSCIWGLCTQEISPPYFCYSLPSHSLEGRTDRRPAYTEAKTFPNNFAKTRILPTAWIQWLIPCVYDLANDPRHTFINRSTTSAMVVCWSNLN